MLRFRLFVSLLRCFAISRSIDRSIDIKDYK